MHDTDHDHLTAIADALDEAAFTTDGPPRLHQAQTQLGTPTAKSWDAPWIRRVQVEENDLGRRICGARTPAGVPCTLTSDHPTGRCRFHGGFDLTGAPKGNRNAVLHGLYSRRLMPCGTHCPMWQSCPLGGGDMTMPGSDSSTDCTDYTDLNDSPRRRGKHREEQRPLTRGTGGSPVRMAEPAMPQNNESNSDSGAGGSPANDRSGDPDGGRAARPTTKEPAFDPAPYIEKKPWGFGGIRRDTQAQTPGSDNPAHRNTYPTSSKSGGSGDAPPATGRAGADILRLPLSQRPICPYEQSEYNTVVTDATQRIASRRDPFATHIIHMLALAQVMVSRAAVALRETEMTETYEIKSATYSMRTSKVAAAQTAYDRLVRQWQRLTRDFNRQYSLDHYQAQDADHARHRFRTQHDTDPAPDAQTAMHFADTPRAEILVEDTLQQRREDRTKRETEKHEAQKLRDFMRDEELEETCPDFDEEEAWKDFLKQYNQQKDADGHPPPDADLLNLYETCMTPQKQREPATDRTDETDKDDSPRSCGERGEELSHLDGGAGGSPARGREEQTEPP